MKGTVGDMWSEDERAEMKDATEGSPRGFRVDSNGEKAVRMVAVDRSRWEMMQFGSRGVKARICMGGIVPIGCLGVKSLWQSGLNPWELRQTALWY